MRFNRYGPMDAYEEKLHPAAQAALERGSEQYGGLWLESLDEDASALWNAQHTIDVHAQCRIKEALERLDYGDIDGFVEKLGSAVGYLSNAICKVCYLEQKTRRGQAEDV